MEKGARGQLAALGAVTWLDGELLSRLRDTKGVQASRVGLKQGEVLIVPAGMVRGGA